jgi:SAM-dependent methyltransferase
MENDTIARLLGPVRGKRVLELGCGAGAASIGLVQNGATVIGIDSSPDAIESARAAAERAEVRLDLRAGDLADLAFLRADSIDAAASDGALAAIGDLGRLFRQVHRVLRPGAPFAFSLPHPMALGTETEPLPEGALPLGRTYVSRSYFDDAPIDLESDGARLVVTRHTLSEVFTGLTRAGFRVDTLLEPEPAYEHGGRALLPDTVVWRARKEGS